MISESENLSAEQSLDIITKMIRQAQGKVQRNTFYFLLWGWVVTLANIGMYVLIQLEYQYPYIVWTITIPAWIVTMLKGYQQGKTAPSGTHFDRITAWLWVTFGICIFTLVAFGYKINWQLNPVILIVSAIPTIASGVILRFTPLIMGGISFWAFGIICFLVPGETQFLIGALAIACGYLVPGYILKKKEN